MQEEADSYLCHLTIEDLLPDNLGQVPMDRLLRFVEEHREEREEFQKQLESLRLELARCQNKEHARYIASDFVKKIEKAKEDYKSAMGFLSKRELCSTISAGIPAAFGLLSLPVAPGAGPYDEIRLGAGLLFGAVAALAARQMVPLNKGTASYLLSAEKLSTYRMHRIFEEFVND